MRDFDAVCLYTTDGEPTNADLDAVREYGNVLRKRYEANPEQVERLARSRQALAAHGLTATGVPAAPGWDELDDDERESARLAARNWLIAAHLARLIPDDEEGA